MEITPAEPKDYPALLALQYLAYRSEAELYQDFNIPPLTQTLEQLQQELENGLGLVLQEEGKINASVRAKLVDGICHIGKLIVEPCRQGQGMGTRLMAEIEAQFPDANGFEVFTGHKSENNIRLYKRLGYQESRTQKLSENLSLVFLHKLR